MIYDRKLIRQVLDNVLQSSKDYVKSDRKSESSTYMAQIWLARGLTKTRAREELTPAVEFEGKQEHKMVIKLLEQRRLLLRFEVEDIDGRDEYLFAVPYVVDLLIMLDDGALSVTEEAFDDMCARAKEHFLERFIEETDIRLREPFLDNEALGTKSSILCWFLLLNGAIFRENAFTLRKKDNREFVHHKDIVRYLDGLSKDLFPSSYEAKKGKQFKVGDLSDFIRRNKEMKDAFGASFQLEGRELFFFDAMHESGGINESVFRGIVRIVLKKLCSQAIEHDNIENALIRTIDKYWIDSPVDRAHRSVLFAGSPPDNYYGYMEHIVDEELKNLSEDHEA